MASCLVGEEWVALYLVAEGGGGGGGGDGVHDKRKEEVLSSTNPKPGKFHVPQNPYGLK